MRVSLLCIGVGVLVICAGAVLTVAAIKTPLEKTVSDFGEDALGPEDRQRVRDEGGEAAASSGSMMASGIATMAVPVNRGQVVQERPAIKIEEEAIAPARSFAAPPESAVLKAKLRASLESAPDMRLTEDILTSLAALQQSDGDIVGMLNGEYTRGQRNVKYCTLVIEALRHVGTNDAKQALLAIALNPLSDHSILGPKAVNAVGALVQTSDEMIPLLVKGDLIVREAAARRMVGMALTPDSVTALATLLDDRAQMHVAVAQTFGQDSDTRTRSQKVEVLMAASTWTDRLKDGDQIEPDWRMSWRAIVLDSYLRALTEMAAPEALQKYLAHDDPMPRSLSAIVVARMGGEVHDEIVRIAVECDDGLLRLSAVTALEKLGTERDLPLLRRLADDDPWHLARRGDNEQLVYPVRAAAKRVIDVISDPG